MRGIYDSQNSLGLASLFDSSDKNQTYKPKDGGLGITVIPPNKSNETNSTDNKQNSTKIEKKKMPKINVGLRKHDLFEFLIVKTPEFADELR